MPKQPAHNVEARRFFSDVRSTNVYTEVSTGVIPKADLQVPSSSAIPKCQYPSAIPQGAILKFNRAIDSQRSS